MDQYMTPVQQQNDMPQYAQQQLPPMQMYPQQQQVQQLPMHAMMTPVAVTEPALPEKVICQASIQPNAVIPDWLRDALVIAGVTFAISHPSTRAMLSQWLPMIGSDRQSSVLGLLVFGLLVGLGSAAANRALVQKNA
jgi:hypothetical protein